RPAHPLAVEQTEVAIRAGRSRARQVNREPGIGVEPAAVVETLAAVERGRRRLRARGLGGGNNAGTEVAGIGRRLNRVAGALREQAWQLGVRLERRGRRIVLLRGGQLRECRYGVVRECPERGRMRLAVPDLVEDDRVAGMDA